MRRWALDVYHYRQVDQESITVHCAGNFNAESCVALKDALSGAFKKVALR